MHAYSSSLLHLLLMFFYCFFSSIRPASAHSKTCSFLLRHLLLFLLFLCFSSSCCYPCVSRRVQTCSDMSKQRPHPLLPLGGAGVRKSSHLPPRSFAEGRSKGTRHILHCPLHRLLQEGRPPYRVLRRAATGGRNPPLSACPGLPSILCRRIFTRISILFLFIIISLVCLNILGPRAVWTDVF